MLSVKLQSLRSPLPKLLFAKLDLKHTLMITTKLLHSKKKYFKVLKKKYFIVLKHQVLR